MADALSNPEPSTRAVAARELGVLHKPEYLSALRRAADDPDLLVASNALEGLLRYEDHSSAPQLREIALMGGVMTSLAANALTDWRDADVLPIGRKLMTHRDPGDQLAGIRAVGLMGDPSDLASLRDLMKNDEKMGQGSRGFGLMPAISTGARRAPPPKTSLSASRLTGNLRTPNQTPHPRIRHKPVASRQPTSVSAAPNREAGAQCVR